jgi:site-specific DNA recombinase
VSSTPSHTRQHVYRCTPATRNRAYRGGHVARQAAPVEDFIAKLVIGRLSRSDAADLIAVPEGGPDVGALREEATAIRRNLEELAADRALNLIGRAPMLAATNRANLRLAEIGTELESAARENVLTPLVAAGNAASVWEDLDLSRKRAVLRTLMTITLCSPGRGARRAFDPATVQVCWRQQEG